MASSYILLDSLLRLTLKKPQLTHSQKIWLIETINKKLNLDGKEKLYSLLILFNKRNNIQDQNEPFYDIENIDKQMQNVWYEFTKMHLKTQT